MVEKEASRYGILKFIRKFEQTGRIGRRIGSSRPTVITILKVVEDQMQQDDETTAAQFYPLLRENGYNISLRTILRCKKQLG